MRKYFWTEDRCVSRLDLNKEKKQYENAEVLRDGKWVSIAPAELLWNANPISKAEAVEKLSIYSPHAEKDILLLDR